MKSELAARPDVSGLAMIALYPTAEEAGAIFTAGGNPAETIHVTMVFLGEAANIDMKAAARADEGIESGTEFDWVPHATLAYVEEPALPDLSVIGKSLTFDQLSLVEADVRKDFPFDPEGSSDDVHRPDPFMDQLLDHMSRSIHEPIHTPVVNGPLILRTTASHTSEIKFLSRSQQRRRDILISRAKEDMA